MRVREAAVVALARLLLQSIFAICRARYRATTDQAFLTLGLALVPCSCMLRPGFRLQFWIYRVTAGGWADGACSEGATRFSTSISSTLLLSACLLPLLPARSHNLPAYCTDTFTHHPCQQPSATGNAVTTCTMLRPLVYDSLVTRRPGPAPIPFHFISYLTPQPTQS